MTSSVDDSLFAVRSSSPEEDLVSASFAGGYETRLGVGFSLNPLTNDYDEAVIDANWGLGESVVSGFVSPDHFIVDKVGRHVVDKNLGAKQVSIWQGPDGGTIERKGHRSAELTLSDAQLGDRRNVSHRGALLQSNGHRVGLRRRPTSRAAGPAPLPPTCRSRPKWSPSPENAVGSTSTPRCRRA